MLSHLTEMMSQMMMIMVTGETILMLMLKKLSMKMKNVMVEAPLTALLVEISENICRRKGFRHE